MARALQQIKVAKGSQVLELGCGWGAVAEMATQMGAQLKGITLSHEQLAFGQARLAAMPAQTGSTLEYIDYRDVIAKHGAGTFDAVVSIEMFEAIGMSYWDSYFATIHAALKPNGKACVQTIYIDDALFERYQAGTDFIQQYIFPGGMLPSPSTFKQYAEKAGLRVVDRFDFGLDYAETLRRWRSKFMAHLDEVRALGFDDRFIRLWEFYLVYCEAAFDTKNTGVAQYTLEKA
jgi:cyclopropane-fatty-acyl-phospholipid synthase